MLIVIPKWEVTVMMPNGDTNRFWVSDMCIENVLANVAKMRFSAGVDQPDVITVKRAA